MTSATLDVAVNVIRIETTCPFRPSLVNLKHLMIDGVLLLTHSLQLRSLHNGSESASERPASHNSHPFHSKKSIIMRLRQCTFRLPGPDVLLMKSDKYQNCRATCAERFSSLCSHICKLHPIDLCLPFQIGQDISPVVHIASLCCRNF